MSEEKVNPVARLLICDAFRDVMSNEDVADDRHDDAARSLIRSLQEHGFRITSLQMIEREPFSYRDDDWSPPSQGFTTTSFAIPTPEQAAIALAQIKEQSK